MKENLKKMAGVASEEELTRREEILKLFYESPIPKNEILANLGLFQNGPSLARILFMNEIYKKITNIHGVIIEFGCRWGQNLALFENFRAIYEPYNFNRKIIGFDTFEGFPSVSEKDGYLAQTTNFTVAPGYENYLEAILALHEKNNPMNHLRKFEIIKGDASTELKKYLERNPETIIALAYFDFDLYEPTKNCINMIQDYLAKGSIIGFDELNYPTFPGETLAFKEVLGLKNHKLHRSVYSRANSFIEME